MTKQPIEETIIKLANKTHRKVVGICLKRIKKKADKAAKEFELERANAQRLYDSIETIRQRAKFLEESAKNKLADKTCVYSCTADKAENLLADKLLQD